jgi:hypothetical protein
MDSGIKSFTVTTPDNLRWMMVQKPLSFIRFDVRQKNVSNVGTVVALR